jgi:hypothetical protein
MKLLSCALIAIALGLATGCTTSAVDPGVAGGGDDFPNSKNTVASTLAQNTQLYSNWNQFGQVPDTQSTDLAAADSLIASATTTHTALSKPASGKALSDSISWDLSDSASGTVLQYRVRDDLLTLTSEKRVIRWDLAARDSIVGNEFVVALAGTVENKITKAVLEYYFFDTDQNGFFDLAFIRFTQQVLGIYYQTSVWAVSGNDNNFTVREKRRMYRVMNLQILGADTLQLTDIRDADGDSAIFKHGVVNTVTATIRSKSLYPVLTNQPAVSAVSLRASLPATDSSHWAVQTFHSASVYGDGHSENVTIAGTLADSILRPNDSAVIIFQSLSAPAPSYDSTTVRFSVILGASINDKQHHALISYAITYVNNHQNVRSLLYSFVSEAPIYPATSPDSIGGTIHADVTYADGTSGWATAVFGDGIFDITYQPPTGSLVQFKCTKDGTVLP